MHFFALSENLLSVYMEKAHGLSNSLRISLFFLCLFFNNLFYIWIYKTMNEKFTMIKKYQMTFKFIHFMNIKIAFKTEIHGRYLFE